MEKSILIDWSPNRRVTLYEATNGRSIYFKVVMIKSDGFIKSETFSIANSTDAEKLFAKWYDESLEEVYP